MATRRPRAPVLERLGLSAGHAKVDELSGGQQQRLMIARALMHEPEVLFLDEPTVGLDPQARRALWEILRDLHAQGRTIVMTTHYMEEADQLCDRVAIIDRGHLLAFDTPAALKAKAPGGTVVEFTLDGDAGRGGRTARAIAGVARAEAHGHDLRAYAERGGELIPPLIHAAEACGAPSATSASPTQPGDPVHLAHREEARLSASTPDCAGRPDRGVPGAAPPRRPASRVASCPSSCCARRCSRCSS